MNGRLGFPKPLKKGFEYVGELKSVEKCDLGLLRGGPNGDG